MPGCKWGVFGRVCAGWSPNHCVFPVAALRFSISNDLKFDAERDLKDIDASSIPVHALNKVGPSGSSFTEPEKSNFLFFFFLSALV